MRADWPCNLMYSTPDQEPFSLLPCGLAHGSSNLISLCLSAPSANGLLSHAAAMRINIKSCLRAGDDVQEDHIEEHRQHGRLPIAQKLVSRTTPSQQICSSLKLRDGKGMVWGSQIGISDASKSGVSRASWRSSASDD